MPGPLHAEELALHPSIVLHVDKSECKPAVAHLHIDLASSRVGEVYAVCCLQQAGFSDICSAGELVTHHMDNASSKVGRVNSNGIMGVVEPSCRMIALHIYDAVVRVSFVHDVVIVGLWKAMLHALEPSNSVGEGMGGEQGERKRRDAGGGGGEKLLHVLL